MKEKFEKFIDKFNNYFGIPLILFVLLTCISINVKNEIFGTVINYIISIIFICYTVFIVALIWNKLIKQKFMISMLITSSVLLVLSYILSFANVLNTSNVLFIVGVIFLELYLLCIIVNSCFYKTNNIGTIITFSLIFIVLGFITIYLSCYNESNNDLFNALISIFAALIGGAVTLVGVAWTINNNKVEKKQEEIEKARPYFTFNIVHHKPENIDGLKICFPEDLELNYDCDTYGEIENSKHSVVILKRLYHDNKWFDLQCNNTLIHSGRLILNFKFTNPNDIYLEVSDVIGNVYYYRINVLHTALLGGTGNGVHTIRNIELIDISVLENSNNPAKN